MKDKKNKDRMSKQARREMKALRRDLINYLMNGDNYSFPVSKRVN